MFPSGNGLAVVKRLHERLRQCLSLSRVFLMFGSLIATERPDQTEHGSQEDGLSAALNHVAQQLHRLSSGTSR